MSFSNNDINSDAYQHHHVFEEIERIRGYYQDLSHTCFSFVPLGVSAIGNYASYVFLSIEGTLHSISMLLKAGHLTDAYELVRKVFDTVLVEIYIDVERKEKFGDRPDVFVEEVEEWLKGKHRIPSLERIQIRLKNSLSTKDLYPFFGWDTYLKKNRELLNDNVHINRYTSILYNCNELAIDGGLSRLKKLEGVSILLRQAFMIHLSFIFRLNSHYMMATDYIDSLECGAIPPEGSQYWLAPYAQEAFDEYIKPYNELAAFIKDTCPMEIA